MNVCEIENGKMRVTRELFAADLAVAETSNKEPLMADALKLLRSDFLRVEEEIRKAGCYLSVWAAWQKVPDSIDRSNRSPCQSSVFYSRQAIHMAFATTLYSQLEVAKDRVNLPGIMKRLSRPSMHTLIAADNGMREETVRTRVQIAQRRYQRWVANHPTTASLKALRNSVVAHHGRDTESHGARIGRLSHLLARTVSVVDAVSCVLDGDETDLKGVMRLVHRDAVGFWAHGIDGEPADREP